jgi:hypothetical protein
MRTSAAVERLAELFGARLRWIGPAPEGVVNINLTGFTAEEALARVLRNRSYMLVLGKQPEIQVLAGAADASGSAAQVWQPIDLEPVEDANIHAEAGHDETEAEVSAPADQDGGSSSAQESHPVQPIDQARELAQLRRIAQIDEIAHAPGKRKMIGSELDAIVRGDDEPAVRLAAAERLFSIDPSHAETSLAWLASDADSAVSQRAEALLAAARESRADADLGARR